MLNLNFHSIVKKYLNILQICKTVKNVLNANIVKFSLQLSYTNFLSLQYGISHNRLKIDQNSIGIVIKINFLNIVTNFIFQF